MTSPTPEQQAAIDSRAKRRVIIAHPGTGKTFTIVEILADYLENRLRAAECITAVSFTRSAAAELRERARTRVGWKARDVMFGTSSALALAIIRECHRAVGLPRAVTIYDEVDQRDVMQNVIESRKLSGLSVKKAIEALSAARARQAGEWSAKAMDAAQAYELQIKKAGAIDLEQLLPLAVLALQEDKRALTRWRFRCRYLIVDEYQDTAPAEAALYAILQPEELVIVGDPNQEIYAFRGTTNRYLLDAGAVEGTETFFLSQSFRSTAAVVDAANNLISHNPDQPAEKLKPARDGGEFVVHQVEDEEQEANLIIRTCKRALDAGETIAILSRTNRRIGTAFGALRNAGLPIHELSLPRSFYRLQEVRTFHAAFRALHNPLDEIAVSTLCETWPGLPRPNSDEWFDAQREVNLTDVPLLELADWDLLGFDAVRFEQLVSRVTTTLSTIYEEAFRETRAANVADAGDRALAWAQASGDVSLRDFVDFLQSREIEAAPRPEGADEAVNIGTVHGAKGLEWDQVLIVGAEEGHMPHERADLAEERRLAYVGVTRARVGCGLTAIASGKQLSTSCFELREPMC